MNPARLRECLSALGWSQRDLARVLECDDRLIRRWAGGAGSVPPAVAAWLETRARHAEKYPPPDDWRRAPFGR